MSARPYAAAGAGLLLIVTPVVLVATASTSQQLTLSGCTVPLDRTPPAAAGDPGGGPATVTLDATQMANAATITAVAKTLGLPEQAAAVALAAAMQESGLHNVGYGDRDSLGLFQQRPSQGWGTPTQLLDPTYAATAFLTHLEQVPGWAQLPPWQAAQAVQRSADGTLYARWTTFATTLAGTLWTTTPTATAATPGGSPAGASSGPASIALPAGAVPACDPGPGGLPDDAGGPTAALQALHYAEAQLGKPYQWGATGPDSYDCSGLVYAAYRSVGVTLPRTSEAQWTAGTHIPDSQLAAGDLLLFDPDPGTGLPGHVGLYIGNGTMIDAPHTGTVVREEPVAHFGTYMGAVRVTHDTSPSPVTT